MRIHDQFKAVFGYFLILSSLASSQAVDTPLSEDGNEDPASMRINAIFANIPDYEPPCEEIPLLYANGVTNGIPEDKRFDFQSIRRNGGIFDQKKEYVEELRKELKPLYEEWLFYALDYYSQLRAYRENSSESFTLENLLGNRHLKTASDRVMVSYAKHLFASYRLYYFESDLRATAQGYYDTMVKGAPPQVPFWEVYERAQKEPGYLDKLNKERLKKHPSAFDGLDYQDQSKMVQAFHKRLICLRDARIKIFAELANNTITLEKSLAAYIEASKGQKIGFSETNAVDEANAQIERAILQQKYLWLVDEFAIHTSIYKEMLLSHERKLRNTGLFPLLRAQQLENPAIGPNQKLPPYRGLDQARESLARTRARFAYLVLLESEAKLEASSLSNASYIRHFQEALGGEFSKFFGGMKSMATWLWQRDWQDVRTWEGFKDAGLSLTQTIAMFGGMTYQVGTGTLDTALISPMKDVMILGSRKTGLIDGWKTNAERNYEKYKESSIQYSPRIHFMEHLVTSLDVREGRQYIDHLKQGARTVGSAGASGAYGSKVFGDLLSDATFNAATKGGLAWIIEPLAEDPADHAALWLHWSRHAAKGSIQAAQNRIAVARGIELENPDAAVSTVDLRLGASSVKNAKSDFLFELPSIIKNYFGDRIGSVYATQYDFMQSLEQQLAEIDLVLGDLSRPQVAYQPEALYRLDPDAYRRYQSLVNFNSEFAQADYHLKHQRWQRIKQYNTALQSFYHGRQLTVQGETMLAALQREEERRFAKMETHLGYLKLVYMSQTAEYKGASLQAKALQDLENRRFENLGVARRIDNSVLIAELESLAAANQAITAWESLLNQAIMTVIVSPFSTYMNERFLSHFDDKWLVAFRSAGAKKWEDELVRTFFPWSKLAAENGILEIVKGAAWDVTKARSAEAFSDAYKIAGDKWNANASYWLTGSIGEMLGQSKLGDSFHIDPNLHADDAEKLLSELFDIGWDLGAHAVKIGSDNMARASVNWYADAQQFDLLMRKAEEARSQLHNVLDETTEVALKRLTEADLENLSPAERKKLYDDLEASAERPVNDPNVGEAYAQYRKAFQQLEMEYAALDKRLQSFKRATGYLSMLSTVRDAAIDQIKRTAWSAHNSAAKLSAPTQALAASELRTRILFKAHTIEDLESLVSSDVRTNLGMPDQVLRRGADIDLLRDAFKSTIEEAKARGDSSMLERIDAVATAIDEIRINKINTLLGEFMNQAGMSDKVALIIQGGAAKGNPEYQGIFGDIDFTLLLESHAVGEADAIKSQLLDYFEEAGYPLARSKEDPSSMDSEAFVQPFEHFDSSNASLKEVILDLVEKAKDPTRFYTEAGTEWFINNAAYSGKPLWTKPGRSLATITSPRSRGHGLAIDMARYLGFLASPKYTRAYLAAHPEKRYEYLESALGKAKYFIRLIDAYEIGHPDGNELYNNRQANKADTGLGASYHWQIYEDAKRILEKQGNQPGAVFQPSDLPFIEIVAKLKLKGEYESPWEVIKEGNPSMSDEQAMEKAHEVVDWMRDKAPDVFGYLGQVWHETSMADATSSNPRDRAKIAAETHRKMATVKNIMELDGPESMAFIVPKMKNGELMTAEEHASEIRRLLGLATQGRPVADGVERILQNRQPNDMFTGKTRQEIDAYLATAELTARPSPEELEVFAVEQHFKDWFAYTIAVSRMIEDY